MEISLSLCGKRKEIMKNITTRGAGPQDAKTYIEWLGAASEVNLVDPKVYSYPTCNTLVIEKNGSPVLMNSFHLVSMMEALAPKPGLPPLDEARALKSLFDTVKGASEMSGVKEVWFGCKDETLAKFVEGRRGFERIKFPMFRMQI